MAASFRGFPPEAVTFYEGLEADNSRTYWLAHKDVYERAVKEPFRLLSEAVSEEFSPLRLFRPNRDVRFSADKSPYKTAAGAYGEGEDGAGYYAQISAQGLFVGLGYYQMASDQLVRYRAAVDATGPGTELETIVAGLERAGMSIGGEALKTAPRGYPKDHPRVRLLRHKGLYAGRQFPPAKWLGTAGALGRITDTWRTLRPLARWLDTNVGASELPPADAERW